MQQIIQLEVDVDLAAIRARIEVAEFSHVVLVVPRDCVVLQNVSGMQLLRRAADDLGAQIALVAHDEAVRDSADEFGIPTFGSIAQAQRARWKMKPPLHRTGLRVAASVERKPFALTPDLIHEWRGALVAIVLVLLGLGVAAFFLVPTAQVHLIPASLALTATTDIMIDSSIPQVNAETRSIPARRLNHEISGTLQLKTTTTKTIPDARSTGAVTFTNLRAEETVLPPGTIVKTSAGIPIRFTTLTTVTIPAGINSRVDAPIQAVDPGPSGNVKELAINTMEGSASLGARVINLKATVSGNVRVVKVVTADDKKKLEDQLTKQLQLQAPAILGALLKPTEMVPPDSIQVEVQDKQFDHGVDEPADVLNLKITANAFGLAADQDDLNALLSTLLQKQMQSGYQMLPNGIKVETLPGGKFQGIPLRQPIRATGYTTPQLDAAKVARALQGKSVDEARAYLASQISLAQPAEIRVTPPGWFRMPWLSFRIAVFIEPQVVGK